MKVPIKQIQGTPFGGFQCTEAHKFDTLAREILVRHLQEAARVLAQHFLGLPAP